MIHILRIVTRLNIGGPTHHVRILSTGLSPRRFQTLVVAGRPGPDEGDLTRELKRAAHVIVIPELGRALHPWRDLVAGWKLLLIIRRFEPDIVHTHMAKAGALGRSAAWLLNAVRRRSRCRIVHTFHGHVLEGYFSTPLARAFLWCERWLARRSDRLVAINEVVKRQLLEFRIGRPDQVVTIPLGLDVEPLLSLNGHAEAAPPRAWRLGMIGRLAPVKNHALLLEALRIWRDRVPEAEWVVSIIGDGPQRAALQRQARDLRLDDRVRFCGWQRALDSVYNGVDAACLTSRNEGTPVALIEALAAARPVVAADVGGVSELLGASCPGGQPFVVAPRGVVVRPHDAEALAEALAWAVSHRETHQQTAWQGREYVRTQFSAQRLVADIDALYQTLMASREDTRCMR